MASQMSLPASFLTPMTNPEMTHSSQYNEDLGA